MKAEQEKRKSFVDVLIFLLLSWLLHGGLVLWSESFADYRKKTEKKLSFESQVEFAVLDIPVKEDPPPKPQDIPVKEDPVATVIPKEKKSKRTRIRPSPTNKVRVNPDSSEDSKKNTPTPTPPKQIDNPPEESSNSATEEKEKIARLKNIDLNSRSIALGVIEPTPTGTWIDERSTQTKAEKEAALRNRLNKELLSAVNKKVYAQQKQPPKLKEQSDGSFTYQGAVLSARIQPNGRVLFSDRKVSLDSLIGDDVPANPQLTMRFDLNSAIESATGNDPRYVERRWFMKHTEELRNQLEDQYASKQLEQSLFKLRKKLIRIWNRKALSDTEKRKSVFKIWDECAEDQAGMRARNVVVSFIRKHAHQNSPLAYKDEEIQKFNAIKRSQEKFQPYP